MKRTLLKKIVKLKRLIYTHKMRSKFYLQFLILCIAAGVGSALFSIATEYAYRFCIQVYNTEKYAMLIYCPLLFALIVYILKNYFPYAGGSGLPQGYALDIYEKSKLHATYSMPTMIGKVILTFTSIIAGASLGREGPTIQICASIFSSIKNISAQRKKFLIRVGSGVGVATAFNAPLGGIIFTIEEYLKHSRSTMNVALLIGIAIAGYFTVIITGDYSYMGNINVAQLFYSWQGIIMAIVAGIICGLTGALFTWLIVFISVDQGSKFDQLRKKHYILNAIVFGLGIAVLGLLSQGISFGNGSNTTRIFINNNVTAPWYYALSKACGAIFSVAGGVPGGYFSTALSIGAGVMGIFHSFIPAIPLQQYYLLGMVGFLSAITAAPITAVVMVMSIVSDTQHFALPLILTSVLASYISGLFGESVYQQQVLIYVDKEKYYATKK